MYVSGKLGQGGEHTLYKNIEESPFVYFYCILHV